MEDSNNNYVYRHRRLDTNEIFYIGIGNRVNNYRAYSTHCRNRWWKNITNKTEYTVEILCDNIDRESAKELEIFLISSYGRRDLNMGNLCNLTDGGEGVLGIVQTQESKDKRAKKIQEKYKGEGNPFYGKNHSEETKKHIGDLQKEWFTYEGGSWENVTIGKYNSSTNNKKSKRVINKRTGLEFNSLREASEYYNIPYATMKGRMRGERVNRNELQYVEILY